MQNEALPGDMTVIEIKPHCWGWKVFEAPVVEPVFPQKRQAIDYAETRRSFDEVLFHTTYHKHRPDIAQREKHCGI
jgi:hypothetical protein